MSEFTKIKNIPNATDSSGVSYSDIPNGELAYRLWEQHKINANSLEETLPMGMWADEMGIDNKDFKAMLEFSEEQGYIPTDRSISSTFIPEDSEARLVLQGQTFGWGDEIVGGMAAVGDILTGKSEEASLGELYTQYRDLERQHIKDYRQNYPMKALGYELGGAIMSPLGILKAPKLIKQGYDTLSKGKKAMVVAGGVGTVYGAGTSEEETASGVAKDAVIVGAGSSLFGLGFQKAIALSGKAGEVVSKLWKKSVKEPRIETLRNVKNAAYAIVDKSKARFDASDFKSLYDKAVVIARNNHHEELKEAGVNGALNILKSLKKKGEEGTTYTLTQLDKVKQLLSARYKANPEQKAILEMVDEIDTLIQAKGAVFPELEAARLANTRYKKAEVLEDAFDRVKRELTGKVEVSESQLYKNAIRKILDNKNSIKWFSAEEKAMMEYVLKGNILDRALSRTAMFSPSTNKILTVMAFAGSYFQPLFLIPTTLGILANKTANRTVREKANELVNKIGHIQKPPVVAPSGTTQVTAAGNAIVQGE